MSVAPLLNSQMQMGSPSLNWSQMVPTMALLDRLVFVLSWDILFGTVWHRFGIF